MRVVSGILRNRRFQVPKDAVRPTKEQVREAVFSSLGGRCDGWRVLDLFAGAGGLGLEAWSRGAAEVCFVEKNPKVWRVLSDNVEQLREDGLGAVRCVRGDALTFLRSRPPAFDLILADPPYDLPDAMDQTLQGIAAHSVLAPDGRVVYELRSSDRFELPPDWELLRDKVFGAARVLMLKQKKGELSE
jgi:16S rRNA (guanine966-N2)-methyltransferase